VINKETLKDFTTKAIACLDRAGSLYPCLDKPGDIIQCPPSALCKGDFYVMGFNPGELKKGGADGGDKFLRETTQELVSAKTNDAHPLSGWPRGWSNFTNLAKALEVEDWQHNLFTTNLFPDSSSGVSAWLGKHGGRRQHLEYVREIWPLHQLFLSVVRPRFVIVHGQGSRNSAFRYLWEYFVQQKDSAADWNNTMAPATGGDLSIKSFPMAKLELGEGEPLSDVTFIGIKHLSRSQSDLEVMKVLIRQ
jgi:hypothetical protein